MDFLERVVFFYQVFILSPLQCTVTNCRNCKRLREFEEIEILSQSCRGYFQWQGGKLLRILSGFRPRIRPQEKQQHRDALTIDGKSQRKRSGTHRSGAECYAILYQGLRISGGGT
jgi:hypothetical protein